MGLGVLLRKGAGLVATQAVKATPAGQALTALGAQRGKTKVDIYKVVGLLHDAIAGDSERIERLEARVAKLEGDE